MLTVIEILKFNYMYINYHFILVALNKFTLLKDWGVLDA